MIRITDLTDPDRNAMVDVDTVAPTVGHWLAADGALSARPSPTVVALELALRRADWSAVHALADHLSLSVEAF